MQPTPEADSLAPAWWWENTPSLLAEGYSDHCLWQPGRDPEAPEGRHGAHMARLAPGDRVLRFHETTCVTIGIVEGMARRGYPPRVRRHLNEAEWGYQVPITPVALDGQIALRDIPRVWRAHTGRPFNKRGAAGKALLHPLPAPFVSWLLQHFAAVIPEAVLPAQPLPDTHTAAWLQLYRQELAGLYPDPAVRRLCLETLADTIDIAHQCGPGSWTVAFPVPGLLRMNVGKIEVCVFRHSELYLVLDAEALSPADWAVVEGALSDLPEAGPQYRSAPFARGCTLSLHSLAERLPHTRAALQAAVRRAAGGTFGGTPYAHVHQPYLIEYLREELGRNLPQPASRSPAARPTGTLPLPEIVPAWHSGDWQPAWLIDVPPERGDLADLLAGSRAGDHSLWPVSRYQHEMRAGQPVILWQGGPEAGIYAIGALAEAPFEGAPGDWVVPVTYTALLAEPLSVDVLRPALRDLARLPEPHHTVCQVTEDLWAALQPLLPPARQRA